MNKIFTLPATIKKSAIAFLAVLFCLIMNSEMGFGQVYTENFNENWTGATAQSPAPTVNGWTSNRPAGSANAWHRNDYITNWASGNGSPSANGYTGAAGDYYARFHTYDIASGTSSYINSPSINLSTYSSCTLTFYYINPGGGDVMNLSFSNDGGSTFTLIGSATTQSSWTQYSVIIPAAYLGPTFQMKFNSTSDNGTSDIGVDQIVISAITTNAITGSPFCQGSSVAVPFNANGIFNSGNVFTAQLSNAAGSFVAPVTIGTLTSSSSGSLNISATIPAGAGAGAGYRIRIISSNPVVTGSDNGANITINNPAAPTANSQSFCQINNPTVANLTTTSGSGIQWYTASSGGSALATGTTLVTGTYYASQTVSGCEGTARVAVSVTISNPAAPTANSQSFCQINNPTVANLTTTSGTGIKWYTASSGGSALAAGTALVTGTYYASQTVSGCEGTARIAVSVTVSNPAAPTANSQSFCQINNPTVANLTTTSGTAIKWYTASTGGAALASTAALATGTYYASQTVGICESATRFAVNVTVGNPAAPTGSTSQSFCTINNPTVANLTATGTAIQWYAAATGGTALASTTALSTATYYASQTLSGCESATRFAVNVTVGNPAAPTGSAAQSFCTINNPTVANLTATGTAIQWYAAATGGTALASTTALSTATYYASQTLSGCESATRFAVNVTVGNPAAPTGSAAQSFCTINNPTVANLTATGTAIQWYAAATGGTALASTTALSTATYYASQTLSGCESATRFAVNVTVGNPAAPTGAGSQPFCTINNPTLASINVTGTAVLWYTTSTGGTAIANTTPLVNGTTYYVSQTVSGCESATRLAVSVTVGNPSAPTGTATQIFCSSSNPTVANLAATGSNIQWYSAATGGTALAAGTGLVDGTHYYASQTPSSCESATRFDVTATVYQPPFITNNPTPASSTLCTNGSINYTVTATGSNLSYQWLFNGNPISNGGDFLGANTATLQITGADPTDAGNYSVVVSGSSPCTSVTSTPVSLTVNQNITFSTQPASNTALCLGQTFTISATISSGTVTTFQWYKNGSPYTAVPGTVSGNTYTLSIPGISATDAGSYKLFVDDGTGTGCPSAFSGTAVLSVNNSTTTTNPLATQTVCQNTTPTNLSVTGAGTGPLGYQWYSNTANNNTTGTIISGATTSSYTPPTVTAATTYYYVIVTGTCYSATSATATVTVNPTPVVTTVNTATTCSGISSNISLTASTPSTFTWTIGTVTGSITGASAGSGATINQVLTDPSNSVSGTVQYIVTPTATTGACPGSPYTITVTVNPTPVVTTANNKTICNNTSTNISLTSSTSGTFTWTIGTITGGITGASAGSGATISQTLTDPSNSASGTVQYIVTPTATTGSCPGAPYTITVTVNPTPVVTTVNTATTCSGISPNISLTASTPSTFTWTIGTITGSITGASAGSGASISQVLTDPSNSASGTVQYIVTPTATTGSCPGAPYTITVTVNPTPVVTTVNTATTCSGISSNISLTASTPSTFTWTIGTVTGSITGASAGSGATINQVLTDPSNSVSGTVQYIVTPTATTGACPGSPYTITVTVNPTPVVTTANNKTICNNTSTNISLTSSTSGTFTWTIGTITGGITGASAGSGSTINQNLNNPGASTAGTVQYIVTPTATTGSCPGSPYTITVSVNPTPTATISGSTTVCQNSTFPTVTFANPQAIPVTVVYNVNGGANQSLNINASGTFSGTVSTTNPGTITVNLVSVAYQSGPSCSNPVSGSAIVVVRPTPTATISGTDTVCQNSPSQTVTFTNPQTLPETITYNINGGTNTNINVAANSTATVLAPATTAGIYNYNLVSVVYQTAPTCSNTISGTATITVSAIPSGSIAVTENSGAHPNDNIICQGDAVTFTAPNGGTGASYTWKVNGTTVQGPNTDNTYSTTTLANSQSVTVDVANTNNCGVTFTAPGVTVNPLPVPTLSANKTSICPGTNVTFTATGGSTYNFKVNGSSVQSGSSNTYSTTGLATGIDSITVDVTNSNGCVATSAAVKDTVNALPSGTLNATENSGTPNDNKICAGSSVTFTATSGFTTYNFKINGVSVVSGSSNIYSTTALTNGQVVSVDVTNASGCTATFGPPQSITVYAIPAGSIVITENSGAPNDSTICPGSSVTFTATAGYSNYAFYLNGTGSPLYSGSSNVYSTTSLANGSYVTATVSNTNGCSATFTSNKVTVVPVPTGTLTASANPVCKNTNVDFTATSGFTNYNFKVNGTSVQNGNSNVYSSTGINNGDVVTVDVSNTQTCVATFNSVTMSVNALPMGTLTPVENSGTSANDGKICTGATIVFTATPGFNNYNFKINNITAPGGFGTSNTYSTSSLNNGDIVTVEVTNGTGCVGTLSNPKDTISVYTYTTVAAISGASAVCANASITLTDASTSTTNVWSSSDNTIATVNASTGVVTGVATGTVTISYTLTNNNGCSSVATKNITVYAVPVVNTISGPSQVCKGSTITLTETTTGGTWSSSDNTLATVNNSGLVTGISAGTVVISYSVTNSNSCTTVATQNVTINAVPVAAAIAPAAPHSVCAGLSIQLSDATGGGTWSSDNTIAATVDNTGKVTGIAGNGTITVNISYTVTNASNCTTTVTTPVTVYDIPVPTLTGPNPICPNATDTYTTEAGQFNYQWTVTGGTINSGGTTTDNTITVTWNQPGTRTIYVNYANANGCTGATSATLTTSTGTVPTVTGPNVVCMNSPGNVYITQSGQTNYTWTPSAGTITAGGTGTDNTATITWTTSGQQTVSVNFTDINGCTPATPTIYPVTVRALPTATISGTTAVCQGSPAPNITFTGANGTAPYTFTYTINGGSSQTVTTTSGNSVTVTAPTGTTGTFTYALVNIAGQYCSQAQTGSAVVMVNPLPTATISGTTAVCQGSTAPNVTFTGAGGTAPYTFTYTINGGSNQTVTTTSGNSVTIAVSTGSAGTYTYTLVSVAGQYCSQAQTGSAVVTVRALPTATISGTTAVCQGSTAPNITFTGANGTAPYTFTYTINGGSSQTVTTTSGNSVTVTAPTGTTGTFTYALVSIAGQYCSQAQTGSAVVMVNPLPTATISGTTAVCQGSTAPNVTFTGAGGTAPYTFTYTINGGSNQTVTTTSGNSVTIAVSTGSAGTYTYTLVSVAGQYCSQAQTGSAVVTVRALPTATISGTTAVCQGSTAPNITFTGANGTAPYTFTYTINGGSSQTVTTTSGNSVTVAAPTGTTGTFSYALVSIAGQYCSQAQTGSAVVTVNSLPTATIATSAANVCQNATSPTITFTGANGTAPYTFTYKINSGSNQTINSTGNTATISVSTATVTTYTYTLVSVTSTAGCSQNQTGSASVTVNAPPPAPTITPSSVTMCQGSIQSLYSGVTPISGSPVFSSGNVNIGIPDNSLTGANSTIAVTGIPAGAVINTVSVNFNVTHPYDGDLIINLKAPNSNILNLVDQKGRGGNNFTNTTVNNTSTNPFLTGGGNAPFTGTFTPDADNTSGATSVGSPNVTSFSSLTGTPNGNWILSIIDVAANDVGTLNNWTITISYTVSGTPQSVVWSPATDLFTDAAATTAYLSGNSTAVVYAKPSSPGTKTYLATATNAANCSTSASISLMVNPSPTVSITADYCAFAGQVVLTSTYTPGSTILWSTGKTTDTIHVDVAGNYKVTASNSGGCATTATINVANELVINGNFESGNVGFTSSYPYRTGAGSLNNPPGYAVDTAANYYGPSFLWGKDHTTGHGKFMMVNGAAGPNYQIWQETLNVLPNTTYYFSAWGLELDNLPSPPTPAAANLQFNVNGAQVGTQANLPRPPANINSDSANHQWVRFYGSWTSGPTTTSAIVSITDLQGAVYGNNFGLDDISFGTLSTFVDLVSAAGTDAQTVCVNNAITNIVYSAGSSASQPTITALPPGITSSWNGVNLTISGTPTVAGNYSYTITTTGSCQPASASGTITVQGQKLTVSSGSASQTVCVNTSIANIVYTLSGTATGATVKGLPPGVSGTLSGTTYTISGTPTVAGIFKDTVISTGTCKADTAFGTITVQNQTITLTSGSSNQSVCINNGITSVIYTLGGSATGASVTSGALPAGVTANVSGTSFIISGTPTATGTFIATITTSGTCSQVAVVKDTITVNPNAIITLASGSGTLTTCDSTAITPVMFTIGGSATSASITSGSLPAGVTGNYSSGSFTISGTPTASGTFNYTITATGSCGPVTYSGSITVQKTAITLTSGTASPTVCLGGTFTSIVFTVSGGATGVTMSGAFPAGVTGSYNSGAGTYTISSPGASQTGSFAYTLTATGGCTSNASVTGTITVNNGSVGGTVTPTIPSICSGSGGVLNLTGNTGSVVRWETSVNGGSSWTIIANTTTTLSYTAITVPTQYRVLVKSGTCSGVYSSVASVNIHNYWTGGTSTDWNTASNWSDNQVPSTSCPDVYIQAGTYQPVLASGTATITNLHIQAGGNLTVNGAGVLQIGGNISNAGTFNVAVGTVELNGTSAQSIASGTFTGNAIGNLIISNSAGVNVTGTLNVFTSLTYNKSGAVLNTNGNLTLKSTITQTAWIGDMTNHTINGAVTVERYIATGPSATAPNHAKSWQLLAIPTQGQTIKQAWQEGATATNISSPAAGSAGNPVAGYGTMITSNVSANAASQPSPGFDAYTSPGPSMKVYNTLTNGYDGPLNTNTTPIYNQKGYFVFVRGDRSVTAYNQSASPTILRTKGTLFTPANLPPVTSIGNTLFESIGNPYAAPIDMRNITKTSGVAEFIQVWDPRVGGSYNYGAFVTFQLNAARTDYVVGTNGGASYPANGAIFNYLQSGQAFIMQTAPGMTGTVSFNEACKAGNIALPGTGIFTRGASGGGTATSGSTLRTGIYTVNADSTTGELLDGVLDEFGDTYSNGVDGLDARKSMNTGENLSIKTGGKLLVIERRHTVVDNDTIFLNLTNVRVQQYRYHFDAQNLNTVAAGYVVDNYTNTRTPLNLNGGTDVTFNIINVPGAYAANRFMIVFSPLKVLPVTFTSIKAYKQDKNIEVEWRVSNESNIKEYQAEKSVNGIDFTTLSVVKPTNNNGGSAVYVQPDTKPVTGDNYYRIRSIDMNGAISYTTIVKVQIADSRQDINIYPNPITDGQIHLQFLNEPVGKYGLRLLNSLGQVILSKQVTHADGTTTDLIRWNFNLAHGMYKLEVTKPDGSIKIINVLY